MKRTYNLTVKNQHLIDLFKIHLATLGYSQNNQNTIPVSASEFLEQIQQRGIFYLHQVKPRHIREHYAYLCQRPNRTRPGGLCSAVINHYLYAIRLFLAFLEQTGRITENPISGLTFPKPVSTPREILMQPEISLLYDNCKSLRDRAMLSIFYGCGLRKSEGAALNIKDVQFRTGLLYVREGKGKKRRAVPMSGQVIEDLKNYVHNERYATAGETAIITNYLGIRMTGTSCNGILKQIVERAGIKKVISLHCLRHSIATHLLENGLSVEYVRDFLGHKHLESTQIYTRVNKAL